MICLMDCYTNDRDVTFLSWSCKIKVGISRDFNSKGTRIYFKASNYKPSVFVLQIELYPSAA